VLLFVMNARKYTHPGELRLSELADVFPVGDRSVGFSQNYCLVPLKGMFDVYGARVRLSIQKGVSHVSIDGGRDREVYMRLSNRFPGLVKLGKSSGGPGFGNSTVAS